jgi:hypothetical protein
MMKVHNNRARAVLQIHVSIGKLEDSLDRTEGILDYKINYVNNTLRIVYDPNTISIDEISKLTHE